VAGVIEPALQAAEARRSNVRPTSDLTAYDLYLRALSSFPWFGKEQMAPSEHSRVPAATRKCSPTSP